MFNTGFDPKDLDQFVKYLRQIIDMIIDLFKSLGGKKEDDTTPESTTAAP